MSNTNSEPRFSKINYPRTVEEPPFFPFNNISASNQKHLSGVERMQYDFTKQAGRPSLANSSESNDS